MRTLTTQTSPQKRIPNRDQRKFLIERMERHYHRLQPEWREKIDPEPADIKAARKKVEAWDTAQEKKRRKINQKLGEVWKWLKERILFGERMEALALVKAFEAMKLDQALDAQTVLEDLPVERIEDRKGRKPTWDVDAETLG